MLNQGTYTSIPSGYYIFSHSQKLVQLCHIYISILLIVFIIVFTHHSHVYSWAFNCHCSILGIGCWLWFLVLFFLSIINNLKVGISHWCSYCCWWHGVTWFVSSHHSISLHMHIHLSKITAGFTFVKTTSKFIIGITQSLSLSSFWWIMLCKYFCSICIVSHTSYCWLTFLWWCCSGCGSCLFCFLLFFDSLKLSNFIVFYFLWSLLISILRLIRVRFHWRLCTWHCRTSCCQWKLWLSNSSSLCLLFSLLS